MSQTKIDLRSQVEAAILGSRSLSFEDKKALLVAVESLTEDQLVQLKKVFDEEATEYEKITLLEKNAWEELQSNVAALTT